MIGKKEIYRDVRFFHGAIQFWLDVLPATANDLYGYLQLIS